MHKSLTFTRGRYALYSALRSAGVGPGNSVLMPAYHCRTMIDPVKALQGKVQLYPVMADLAPRPEAIAQAITAAPVPVAAIVIAQYFGRRVGLGDIRSICDHFKVALIEDCSHCAPGPQGLPIELSADTDCGWTEGHSSAHFVVSSPYKFFALPDGGMLWSDSRARYGRMHGAVAGTSSPTDLLLPEITTWLRAGARALQSYKDRRTKLPISASIDWTPCGLDEQVLDQGKPSDAFKPADVDARASHCSRWLHGRADILKVARARRNNFMQWLSATRDLKGARPLFTSMRDEHIPYIFPLLLTDAVEPFYGLKRIGMPVGRWDSMLASDCEVSRRYRLHLLHLPCHQEIQATDMQWMTECIERALS